MYNEALNAERCIRTVFKQLQKDGLTEIGVYFVNDGSRDETAAILERLQAEFPYRALRQNPNQGYGAALLEGARVARHDGYTFGLFMDSDLTNDPKYIRDFWQKIQSNDYDLVKASRYIPGGGMDGVPPHRQWISRSGNWVAAKLFRTGIQDCTNGFRAVRLSLLEGLRFENRDFSIITEELLYLKKMGARMTEIPNTLTSRDAGIAASSFHYKPAVFWRYLKPAVKAFFRR